MYNKQVKLNRKVLSNLAVTNPEVFKNVVEFVK
jgi:ribosomal protein L20